MPPTGSGRSGGGPRGGPRVLVTRARGDAAPLEAALAARGLSPVALPVLRFDTPDDPAPLDAAVADLASFDWAVFASARAVGPVAERLEGPWPRPAPRVAAIGGRTAAALAAADLPVDRQPEDASAEALVGALDDPSGRRVLVPRSDIGRHALVAGLAAAGAHVTAVTAYHTRTADPPDGALAAVATGVDAVTLTSPSSVRHLTALLAAHGLSPVLGAARIVCIGRTTAAAARRAGLAVAAVAARPSVDDLADAVAAALAVRGAAP